MENPGLAGAEINGGLSVGFGDKEPRSLLHDPKRIDQKESSCSQYDVRDENTVVERLGCPRDGGGTQVADAKRIP